MRGPRFTQPLTWASIVLALGVGQAAGCKSCPTGVGCSSGVAFDYGAYERAVGLPQDATIVACVDNRCESVRPGGSPARVRLQRPPTTVTVEMRIDLPSGERILDRTARLVLEDVAPNGEGCEPVCRGAEVRLSPDGLLSGVPKRD